MFQGSVFEKLSIPCLKYSFIFLNFLKFWSSNDQLPALNCMHSFTHQSHCTGKYNQTRENKKSEIHDFGKNELNLNQIWTACQPPLDKLLFREFSIKSTPSGQVALISYENNGKTNPNNSLILNNPNSKPSEAQNLGILENALTWVHLKPTEN